MDTNAPLFDCLAEALSYPSGDFTATMEGCRAALAAHAPGAAEHVATFERAIASMTVGGLQELYAATFDMDPRCALDVGWHVFGETYDRGPFLSSIRAALRDAGIAETAELPDHLTQMLRLIARSTAARSGEYVALIAPALDRIVKVLEADHNPYAFLLRAVRLSVGPSAGPTFRSGDVASGDAAPGESVRPIFRSGDAIRSAKHED